MNWRIEDAIWSGLIGVLPALLPVDHHHRDNAGVMRFLRPAGLLCLVVGVNFGLGFI